MAILLTETDTLILHIPKTAGMFVEYAVRTLGIQHVIPPAIGGQCPRHGTAENYAPAARVAAVIRHPARWIESWWRYQVGGLPDLSGFSYRFPYGIACSGYTLPERTSSCGTSRLRATLLCC
jgi:hypothetical protein